MKVLFDHPNPFLLAHGGLQTQIERSKAALEELGLTVEFLRWWDDGQRGDLIHYFGRPGSDYVDFAHRKGMPVVVCELLGGLAARPAYLRCAQRLLMKGARISLPGEFLARLNWDTYKICDACVANTEWEAYLMRTMFNAPPERVHVVPNGVEDVFFAESTNREGGPASGFLVCTATITERKRVLELTEAAASAGAPLWIIGRPYNENDPYFLRFLEVAHNSPAIIRYTGAVEDRAALASIYHSARGFVLLSAMETRSLSAEEAAAAGCPLLLSDLPWARSMFGNAANYCPLGTTGVTSQHLRYFFDAAPELQPPPRPLHWRAVAEMLSDIYSTL